MWQIQKTAREQVKVTELHPADRKSKKIVLAILIRFPSVRSSTLLVQTVNKINVFGKCQGG